MTSREYAKTDPDFVCHMAPTTSVHGTSDVVDDSIRTVIHHATVVIVVAVVR